MAAPGKLEVFFNGNVKLRKVTDWSILSEIELGPDVQVIDIKVRN